MYPTDDTIVAVATPPGHGGVGIVRLSGRDADPIARAMAGRAGPWPPRRVVRARLDGGDLTADALVTFFQSPHSYTGEDVVELSAHGSPVVLASLVRRATTLGARLARPGEFTLRAHVNGKLDLVQAEAARDLVEAVSPAQARAAFDQLDGTLSTALRAIAAEIREVELKLEASMDFPDEGYHFIGRDEVGAALDGIRGQLAALVQSGARGQLLREGARVVIAGTPNAGKSSLFNALVGADRAIVSAAPGTTRDLITARLVLGDFVAELVDTAGLRDGEDDVEQEGVRRADQALQCADVVIVAADRSRPLSSGDRMVVERARDRRAVMVATKSDLPSAWALDQMSPNALAVSSRTGEGVAALVARLEGMVVGASSGSTNAGGASAGQDGHVLVTNQRHRALLAAVLSHVAHACEAFRETDGALPEEFLSADLQLALDTMEEVTGRRTADELLHEIFARFCIGK